MTQRHVVWWSAGAASTVAAMLTLREHPDAILVYTDTRSERPDNVRFRNDVEAWLGVSINCQGCPHGGVGYWNRIRQVFPDVFDRMAKLERELDNAICRPGGQPVLDELDPNRGDIRTEPTVECSLLCAAVEVELS